MKIVILAHKLIKNMSCISVITMITLMFALILTSSTAMAQITGAIILATFILPLMLMAWLEIDVLGTITYIVEWMGSPDRDMKKSLPSWKLFS